MTFLSRLTEWTEVFAKLGVCLVVPNVIIAVCFCFTQEFRELFAAVWGIFRKRLGTDAPAVEG